MPAIHQKSERITERLAAILKLPDKPTTVSDFLAVITALIASVSALLVLLLLVFGAAAPVEAQPFTLGLISALLVVTLLLLYLNRRGYPLLAGQLLIILISLVAMLMAIRVDGVYDVSTAAYFLIIAMAGLLLGHRAVIWTGVLSILELALITLLNQTPRNFILVNQGDKWVQFAALAVVIGLTSFVFFLAIRNMRVAIVRSERELAERERAEQAEREQRKLAEALRDTSVALSGTLELDEVLDRILEILEHVLPFDGVDIMLIRNDIAHVVRSRGYEQGGEQEVSWSAHFVIGETANLKTMFETHQPLSIPDIWQYEGWKHRSHMDWIRAAIGAPITLEGKVIGFISVVGSEPGMYSAEHARRLQAFAGQAAIAIQNARLYEELTNYSSILEQAVREATAEVGQVVERLETILENSPDAIMLLGESGQIEEINPAFTQMFGYTRAEAREITPYRLAADGEGDAERFGAALAAAQGGEGTRRVEFTAVRRDGSTFDADAALATIPGGNGPRGFVCSVRDITVLKNVERMKDSFISTAAHELRTPLTSVLGFSEILLSRPIDDERRERYLTTIYRQSAHLAQIIDEMLDISRLEAGSGLDAHAEQVDLAELIEDVLQPFYATSPQHTFRLAAEADLPTVRGDPFRLAQAVRNLVSNAVKYSPEGGLVLVEARHVPGYVEVSVTDQGVGIRPEHQAHIFEKFYRIEEPHTAIPGTGLGLSIAELIAEVHGGTIDVESEFGTGSTFTFRMPLSAEEPPPEQAQGEV